MHPSSTGPSRRTVLAGLAVTAAMSGLPRHARADGTDAMTAARAMRNAELTAALLARSTVTLVRPGNQDRVRDLEVAVMQQDGTDLSLRRFAFESPADIRGTKLLVRENDGADNDIWLLLPALGRARRITASRLSGSFAGTDFAYVDLMAMRLEKYDHAIAADAELPDGTPVVVLESRVNDPQYAADIGYTRLRTTLRRPDHVPFRVEYLDGAGTVLKTQVMADPQPTPDGRHILRHRHMTVHATGWETTIRIGNLDFAPDFTASDFRPERLRNS